MKIAMPVDENIMETEVSMSFGRSPYFYIYDTETNEGSFIENTAAAAQGGAGIKAAQIVIDSGAKVLITPRCGENAVDIFKAADVILYKTIDDSPEINIKGYQEGRLRELTDVHAGFHGRGGH